MRVDGALGFAGDPKAIGDSARNQEELGYDGVWVPETGHDPFIVLTLAAAATEKLELGTGIAVAFARNPMSLAILANDLNVLSKGRFILGIGSQVQAHIEKRFSMPWSHPAPRMREFILAMHAIWRAFEGSEKLEFRGRFYTHTLLTPFFSPGKSPYGRPRVFLAAVGEKMTEVAGEVADGLLVHGFTTKPYLEQVTIPALERGLKKAGRRREDFQVSYPAFVVTGEDDDQMRQAEMLVKSQIAFYGSTPAYRPVLELHGWGDLQPQLNALSKQGRWAEMGKLISDEVLDAFAVKGRPDEIAPRLRERFGGLVDRISFYAPYHMSQERWREIVAALKS
jgi:probable F420-dependent oxidoreductase